MDGGRQLAVLLSALDMHYLPQILLTAHHAHAWEKEDPDFDAAPRLGMFGLAPEAIAATAEALLAQGQVHRPAGGVLRAGPPGPPGHVGRPSRGRAPRHGLPDRGRDPAAHAGRPGPQRPVRPASAEEQDVRVNARRAPPGGAGAAGRDTGQPGPVTAPGGPAGPRGRDGNAPDAPRPGRGIRQARPVYPHRAGQHEDHRPETWISSSATRPAPGSATT